MITALIIDDEQPSRDELEYLLKAYEEIEIIGFAQEAAEALREMEKQRPDVVFLDIDMPCVNGIELALRIQDMYPSIVIVFVTAYSQYALEAFQAYPLDYILKPIDEVRFRQTISHVMEQVSLRRMNSKGEGKIFIRCFGKFEVVKADPQQRNLPLANRKMKEILAYLIHRFEKPVSRKELLDLFFNGVEDKKTVNHLHVIIYNIRKALESFGLNREQVLIRKNYTMVIAPGICDYVDFVKYVRKNSAVNETNVAEAEGLIESYRGSYLEEEDYC